MTLIETEQQLEDALATPSASDVDAMRALGGDIMVLGAGGKMGPSLARLARRASDEAGVGRRVIAVSRFSQPELRKELRESGVETVDCDLLDPEQISHLPRCENMLFLAGRKFGSADRPDLTWAMNTMVPAFVGGHFPSSRIVAFSTGNVYPFVHASSGGSVESDTPMPVGEYAQSCLGRERVFEYCSQRSGTPVLLLRLNYAVDLRYGTLVDVARKVWDGVPVPLGVGHVNAIWQGDANSYALRSLPLCASPPAYLNVTGPEILSVRELALFFGEQFKRSPVFQGVESGTALLNNAARCHKLLGPPRVTTDELKRRVAHWVMTGGASLGKPTHFEVGDGKF